MAGGYKTGGRKRGTPNRITAAFKDAVRFVYEDIGGHRAFSAWAQENQTEFYRIAARLIPTEINAEREGITIVVQRLAGKDRDEDTQETPALPKPIKAED